MMLRFDLKAPYLVLSSTDTKGNASADDYCDTHSNKKAYPNAICFTLKPMGNRSEAVALAKLATEYQWKNIIVITSTYHVKRAGFLMEQCVHANVTMIFTTPQYDAWHWLRRFVIEAGGFIDVTMSPQCSAA